MPKKNVTYYLDITSFVCPMTFVRTKLLLEKMQPGETAEIRLNSGEPLQNVPRSILENGDEILSLDPESNENPNVYLLELRKW